MHRSCVDLKAKQNRLTINGNGVNHENFLLCADDETGPTDPLDRADSAGDASVFLRGEKTWLLKLSRLLPTMTSTLGLLKS